VVVLILALATARGEPAATTRATTRRATSRPATTQAAIDTAPGLVLELKAPGEDAIRDARVARLIALHVPAGQTTSTMLPPGPLAARWRGGINLKFRDRYAFVAQGRGEVKLTVNGEVALESSGEDLSLVTGPTIRLNKGYNSITVDYVSPAEGDATFRLYWLGKEFLPEPLPPSALVHERAEAVLPRHALIAEGRCLFVSLRCIRCHADQAPPTGELAQDAPALDGIGSRLDERWMARWISGPRSIRGDAAMPALFAPRADVSDDVRDIAAYLATLGTPMTEAEDVPAEAAQRGEERFTALGCIACHTMPDVVQADAEHARTSLAHVAGKYSSASLRAYLKAPAQHYQWTRMPDFRLTEEEIADLAAYLRSSAPPAEVDAGELGDASRGKQRLIESGCLNCHALADQQTTMTPPSLEQVVDGDWTRGCLAATADLRGKAPDFGFTDAQRHALHAFGAVDVIASLRRRSAVEFADRQIEALRCRACHVIDGAQDTWSAIIPPVQSATLPASAPTTHALIAPDQSRPRIAWAGEKLRYTQLIDTIAGRLDHKPRPWLVARMPGFPAYADGLAEGLVLQHGFAARDEDPPPSETALAGIGKQLVSPNGGFACTTCHAIATAPATASFEAPAPNFMYVRERITRHYYDRWTRNPQRVEPGTRMPQFPDVEGRTALRHTYDGDAAQQFAAIWHYLMLGRSIAPP
jgi:mono/diheme cytochrome c family protein